MLTKPSKSIVITLDNELKIYRRAEVEQSMTLIYTYAAKPRLNLVDSFAEIWTERIYPEPPAEIFFLLGPRSGFTDSRLIYLWLNSNALFTETPFYVHQAGVMLELATYSPAEITAYLDPIRQKNNQTLSYARPPRIN